jgi:hypothetical protein
MRFSAAGDETGPGAPGTPRAVGRERSGGVLESTRLKAESTTSLAPLVLARMGGLETAWKDTAAVRPQGGEEVSSYV